MMANILPTLALFLALVSKCYNHDSFAGRKQLWKPGQNTHAARITGGCLQMLQNNDYEKRLREIKHDLKDVKIPESFDAREQWPNCPSIKEISNQGNCGSCWAFGSVEAMSDRICIHSDGNITFRFSADDLVSCCRNCGGCKGAHDLSVGYDYWVNNGIVSGGSYGSHEGCRPYELPPTFNYFQYLSYGDSDGLATPKCVKECQSNYKIPYAQDLHFGKAAYPVPNDVQQIQTEIMLNGPVTTAFWVYDDFALNYTGHGIYHYTQGKVQDGHAVKIIGWGVEDGTDYWLLANSYGSGWGEKGFFKFIRGENDCGIEQYVWAGIPA